MILTILVIAKLIKNMTSISAVTLNNISVASGGISLRY